MRISFSEAIKTVPQPDGKRWAPLFQHGTLEIETSPGGGTIVRASMA